MKKILACLLAVVMVVGLLPAAALAASEEPSVSAVSEELSVTEASEEPAEEAAEEEAPAEEPEEEIPEEETAEVPEEDAMPALQFIDYDKERKVYSFDNEYDPDKTEAVYISADCELTVDCVEKDLTLIINNANVTLGVGGSVIAEELCIFGSGCITVNGVTFESGHKVTLNSTLTGNDLLAEIYEKYSSEDSDWLNISGELRKDEFLSVWKAVVPYGKTLSLKSGSHLQVTKSLVVDGTLAPEQDAQITVCVDAGVTGVTFYDETGVTEWKDFESYEEKFVYIAADEESQPVKKWMRSFEGGYYTVHYNSEDAQISNDHGSLGDGDKDRFDTAEDSDYELVTFHVDEYPEGVTEPYRIDLEVFGEDWEFYSTSYDTLSFADDKFTFQPTSSADFAVSIWWTEEEFTYDTLQPEGDTEIALIIGCYGFGHWEADALEGVEKKATLGSQTKYIIDTEEISSVLFRLIPDENNNVDSVVLYHPLGIDGTGDLIWPGFFQDERYTEGTEYDTFDLNNFSDYLQEDYTTELSLDFNFSENLRSGDYGVWYEEQGEDQVFVGEESLGSWDVGQFTVNTPVTFAIESYPNCETAPYRVDVEVMGEDTTDVYSTAETGANQITLTQNKSTGRYEFTFTPTSDDPFWVEIWWTEAEYEYDIFEFTLDEGKIFVEVCVEGDGTVTSSDFNVAKSVSYGNQTKYALDAETETINVTFSSKPEELTVGSVLEKETDYSETYTWNVTYAHTLSARFEGCDPESWTTVSWGGGNVSVEDGRVYVERIHVTKDGEETIYTSVPSEYKQGGKYLSLAATLGAPGAPYLYGLAYGPYDLFKYDDELEVTIDFKFVPDYGYQVDSVQTNEGNILQKFDPSAEAVSEFSFAWNDATNVHFQVKFEETEDTVDVSGTALVEGASIQDGENAADSGNLALTVKDTDTNTSITNAVDTLELTLDNVVSKGGDNGNWTENISEFDEPITVTLTLDTDQFDGADYTVYREHDGQLSDLSDSAAYDTQTGELSFETNAFSKYTIVQTAGKTAYDLNGDKKVDAGDLIRLARHILGYTVQFAESADPDINQSGAVNLADCITLLRYLCSQTFSA